MSTKNITLPQVVLGTVWPLPLHNLLKHHDIFLDTNVTFALSPDPMTDTYSYWLDTCLEL